MKEFIVKVTTASGYMLFTIEAADEYNATLSIEGKMIIAGWENVKVEVIND